MTLAVDVIVDVLALALLGVQLLVGAIGGVVSTEPARPAAVIEIEMTLEAPPPDLPLADDLADRS